jgi:hypothetical protein
MYPYKILYFHTEKEGKIGDLSWQTVLCKGDHQTVFIMQQDYLKFFIIINKASNVRDLPNGDWLLSTAESWKYRDLAECIITSVPGASDSL